MQEDGCFCLLSSGFLHLFGLFPHTPPCLLRLAPLTRVAFHSTRPQRYRLVIKSRHEPCFLFARDQNCLSVSFKCTPSVDIFNIISIRCTCIAVCGRSGLKPSRPSGFALSTSDLSIALSNSEYLRPQDGATRAGPCGRAACVFKKPPFSLWLRLFSRFPSSAGSGGCLRPAG